MSRKNLDFFVMPFLRPAEIFGTCTAYRTGRGALPRLPLGSWILPLMIHRKVSLSRAASGFSNVRWACRVGGAGGVLEKRTGE